jgi:hypothetical protein
MDADEKFAACCVIYGIIGFLFLEFSRNAKLKKKWLIWGGVIFALFFLTWSATRIWHSLHSFTLLLVFMCPQILIVPLIMLMSFKKIKICDACGRTIYTGGQLLKNGCCPKCGSPIS